MYDVSKFQVMKVECDVNGSVGYECANVLSSDLSARLLLAYCT